MLNLVSSRIASVSARRFGEAWAALRAENLLTYSSHVGIRHRASAPRHTLAHCGTAVSRVCSCARPPLAAGAGRSQVNHKSQVRSRDPEAMPIRPATGRVPGRVLAPNVIHPRGSAHAAFTPDTARAAQSLMQVLFPGSQRLQLLGRRESGAEMGLSRKRDSACRLPCKATG
jgi:hypothetical protein